MNKLMKILIIINGLIIPILLLFGIFEIFKPFKNNQNGIPAITSTKEEEKKDENIEIEQKLRFNEPLSVINSNNFYLPINTETKILNEGKNYDVLSFKKSGRNNTNSIMTNVIFLDENYRYLKTLLAKKAYIKEVRMEKNNYSFNYESKTINNILYLIGFEDTNNDGLLNQLDKTDLYISDLKGDNLFKLTNDKQIDYFDFYNSSTEVLIKYKTKTVSQFIVYNILKKEFIQTEELNSKIKELEKHLIK